MILPILHHNVRVLMRILLVLLILALPLPAAPSQRQAMRELAKIPAYREGAKAMEDRLPDIAIRKFRETLENKRLKPGARAYASLALAEALVRSSLSEQGDGRQAADALEILDAKELAEIASVPIWKAEALASLGRYQDAAEALAQVPKNHPLHSQAQLARARIQIALNQTEAGIATLNTLATSKKPGIRNTANLLAAEIHIGQGRFKLAEQSLDNINEQHPAAAKLKEYLRARLLLNNGEAAGAINLFQSLITAPDHLSERIFRACVLGLADAQAAGGQNDLAIATLSQYIAEHADSALLQPFFKRLAQLLPEEVPLDNPTLAKLREWSHETPLPENPLTPSGSSAAALPLQLPAADTQDDRSTLSLYYRAKLLARSAKPDHHVRALALLARLRAIQPSRHFTPNELYLQLNSASLLDTAYLHLKQNHPQRATFTLGVMEEVAFSPRLKDQASFLRGLLLAKESRYDDALAAFNFARLSASSDIASAASINAGVMSLLASNLTTFEKIAHSHRKQQHIRTSLALERALWKCSVGNLSGRNDLDAFILAHENHPRENEARLALAAACVDISPPDTILAKAQLDVVSPRLTTEPDQYTITRIGIRAEELEQQWTAAANLAGEFVRRFKDSPHLAAIMLKQGEALYHNEDFNKSRRVFQEIAKQFPESPYRPFADFYAAMAARLGGTTQSREECIGMFQALIDSKHSLAPEARIQQGRVLIDLRRYEEAEKTLAPLQQSDDQSVRRDAGVLLADCFHRQGSTDPAKYKKAVSIYKQLLDQKDLPRAWLNRLHFLRGQTYESMQLRGKALDSYLDVILRANVGRPGADQEEEWLWFYRCGFKALAMLEADRRWEAAVNLARRIASFKGPRAEEAAKRAINLAKTHMIWEE